ncbi:MAG: ketosteroid isomerase-related protein [Verrucomicrobiales bacterium]
MSPPEILQRYYDAFNRGDRETFLSLLTDDVEHYINQGDVERGHDAFRAFMENMDRWYAETIEDLVIFTSQSPDRAAAEFMVRGKYLATADGLPPATGQIYVLPAAAFFTFRDGRIASVRMYYNAADWLRQVS